MMALPSLWVASGEAPAQERFANVHYRRAFLLLRRKSELSWTRVIRRQPFAGNDGRIEDDRGAIGQQRKRLLYGEKEAFHIDVEDRVIELLGYSAEGGIPRNTGIREHN